MSHCVKSHKEQWNPSAIQEQHTLHTAKYKQSDTIKNKEKEHIQITRSQQIDGRLRQILQTSNKCLLNSMIILLKHILKTLNNFKG